jgi:serine/threonine-protein kinase
VFRTYEPRRDRLVAVKAFRIDATPEQARALADELARLPSLDLKDPAIVIPLGAGVEGASAYLAEEYVAAESLDVAMRHYAPAPLDKVLPFLDQLASGIDSAHAAGIAHGALHPRDILVTPDQARATGFGVAAALERTGLRAPVRRPYTAPERIAGARWGAEADVFSLAAIGYELLTGRRVAGPSDEAGPLFADSDAAARVAGIQEVFRNALAEDPSQRYGSARAFTGALRSLLEPREQEGDALAEATAGQSAVDEPPEAMALPAAVADLLTVPETPPEGAATWTEAFESESAPPTGSRRRRRTPAPARPSPDLPLMASEPVATDATPAPEPLLEPEARPAARASRPRSRPRRGESELETVAPPVGAVVPEQVVEADSGTETTARAESPPEAQSLPPKGFWEAASLESDASPDERSDSTAMPVDTSAAAAPIEMTTRPEPIAAPRPRTGLGVIDEARMPPPSAFPEATRPGRLSSLGLVAVFAAGLAIGFAAGYFVRAAPEGGAATAVARSAEPSGGVVTPEPTRTAPTPSAPATPAAAPTAPVAAAPAEPAPVPPATRPAPPARPSSPARETSATRPPALVPARPMAPAPPAASSSADGRILIRTSPAGAQVVINGERRGVTPLAVRNLRYGSYEVSVALPGFGPQSRQVTISAAQPASSVIFELSPGSGTSAPPGAAAAQGVGSLYVDSRPQGARITVNGRPVGTTPALVPSLQAGIHTIRLDLTGFAPWSSSIPIRSREQARVTATLVADR